MKTAKLIPVFLLIALLVFLPAAAAAHGLGGGLLLGLGAGLLTGFALSPWPAYAAPPVYAPPPAVYPYSPAPLPPNPGLYGYPPRASYAPPPAVSGPGCREWRVISRHWGKRWNAYLGRWQTVLIEKRGWVPCNP